MSIRHAPWAEAAPDFAIGLRPIEAAHWLEPGGADPARKDALLASDPASVWGETEGSRPAQAEALAMVEASVGARAQAGMPPLWAASRLVADDLCLMEKRDGAWRLTALSLCSGSFFTADDALGKSLEALHGPVPGFGDRFLKRVERIFDALQPTAVVERRNWTVVNADELYLPRSAPVRDRIAAIDPADAGQALFLRVERQTLRRLPATGALLFTIRIWRHPLADLVAEPERLAAFAAAWRGAAPDFRAYKGAAAYDALVAAFLDQAGVPATDEV